LQNTSFRGLELLESFVAISLAHASHGLSVLALYSLVRALFPEASNQKLAFVTAALHIFSPAGIFLSAPYGESTFALLSFLGYLVFVRSFNVHDQQATLLQDALILISGLLLGLATTVRSNGLLNGLLFLEEAIRATYSLRRGVSLAAMRRVVANGIGGILVGLGFLLPQYIAFQEFCMTSAISEKEPSRIWCKRALPSIYFFVQDYYW
jgi:phosphatidylinositol glycan class V